MLSHIIILTGHAHTHTISHILTPLHSYSREYMYMPSRSHTHILTSSHPHLHILTPPQEHELYPVEIRYGLLEIAEALEFLHSDVKMMHGNVTPECVVVTTGGNWKLMGFNFCCFSQYQSEAQVRVGGGREERRERGRERVRIRREREGGGSGEGGRYMYQRKGAHLYLYSVSPRNPTNRVGGHGLGVVNRYIKAFLHSLAHIKGFF